LNEAFEAGDTAAFARALASFIQGQDMQAIATSCGPSLDALEKVLQPDSDPFFSYLQSICRVLGVRLVVQAQHPRNHP
jgi:DNA-binding phage protein